jgi:hypothetical protein
MKRAKADRKPSTLTRPSGQAVQDLVRIQQQEQSYVDFPQNFWAARKIEPALPSAAEQVNSSLVSDASGYSARKRAAANACTNEAGSMGLDTCA